MQKSRMVRWLMVGVATSAMVVSAGDSPQWRGEQRTGVQDEQDLLKTWPEGGPALLWKIETAGEGYAAPSVVGKRIYVTGSLERDGKRRGFLYALDSAGKELWATDYGAEWAKSYEMARSTPAIVKDLAYLCSGMGEFACVDAMKGGIVWSVDLFDRFSGRNVRWGLAESPLVVDGKVICHPGGPDAAVVALNAKTGATEWQSKGLDDKSAYCSPAVATFGGVEQIVTHTDSRVVGLAVKNGELLWQLPHKNRYGVHPNTPVLLDGHRVVVSSGYGHGTEGIEIGEDGRSASQVWSAKRPDNHFQGMVAIDGRVYASAGGGPLMCLDGKDGHVLYDVKEVKKAALVAAGTQLIAYADKSGAVTLVNARPDGYSIGGSFKVDYGDGPHWAHPVIANGVLYVRHGRVLAAYAIK